MTTEAVIVSTARTGVGKAFRGALNNTEGPTMAGHVMAEAVRRAGIDPGEVEDVVIGCAMQQGTMVMNVARKGGDPGRPASHRCRHHDRSAVCLRPAGDRGRGTLDHA